MNDFTITRVSWHTAVKGNPETREHICQRTWAFVKFLQDNGLVTRQLASGLSEIDEEFEIKRSDVTGEGFELIRRAYDRWLRRIDKGAPPSDVTVFERALTKLRAEKKTEE